VKRTIEPAFKVARNKSSMCGFTSNESLAMVSRPLHGLGFVGPAYPPMNRWATLSHPFYGLGFAVPAYPPMKSVGYSHAVRFTDGVFVVPALPTYESAGYSHAVRFADGAAHFDLAGDHR
jgi:hypothetical protein